MSSAYKSGIDFCFPNAKHIIDKFHVKKELDDFIGRSSDDYTNQEIEQFAYVMRTMRPEEVKAWARSLTLRGINLPDPLKDEFMMLIEE